MKQIEVGDGIRVPLMTVRDWITFAEMAWEEERVALVRDLDESGVPHAERLERLREHSTRRGTVGMLLVATFRIQTATAMVRAAVERVGADADTTFATMTPERVVAVAQRLIGYEPVAASDRPTNPETN